MKLGTFITGMVAALMLGGSAMAQQAQPIVIKLKLPPNRKESLM